MTGPVSRRGFINLVGRAGGAAALHGTLDAMGLLAAPLAEAAPPVLPAGSGHGIRVAVLGAGIAGLTAALALGKAGYQCAVLEARDRAGGRVWTLRGGDTIVETDSAQPVRWHRHPDLYFNAGAARLPHHHTAILGYCRELGVPLEVLVNDNRGALLHDDAAFGGTPQVARRVINDARGFIAELAARALQTEPDSALSEDDRSNVRALLQAFGRLDGQLRYVGSSRAGHAEPPGAGEQSGRIQPPLPLAEIARAASWRTGMSFGENWEQAATMLQPVGGMDALVRGFTRALGSVVTYRAEVVRLRRVGPGARVTWRDARGAAERTLDADFVVCTIPLPVLTSIDADFSEPVKAAIEVGARLYVPAVKVAFQAQPRWWETEHQIYGGITWTSRDITQMWYPSQGLHGPRGILIGAYIWTGAIGDRFAAMRPEDRHAAAVADGERLHPGYAGLVGQPASVAWSKIPFSRGGWIRWQDSAGARRDAYPALVRPDGPYHFAGEHVSHITGWIEGAVRSAHHTVAQIAERVSRRAAYSLPVRS